MHNVAHGAPSTQAPPVDGLIVSCGSLDISLQLACTILAVLAQPHLGLSDAISPDVGNASIWHGSSLAALFERCCQVHARYILMLHTKTRQDRMSRRLNGASFLIHAVDRAHTHTVISVTALQVVAEEMATAFAADGAPGCFDTDDVAEMVRQHASALGDVSALLRDVLRCWAEEPPSQSEPPGGAGVIPDGDAAVWWLDAAGKVRLRCPAAG